MKPLLIVAAVLAPTAALALQGPLTTRMSCDQVQQTVARRGAIVLNFSANTYDRVVRDQRFCLASEGLENIWVPTRDVAQCFAGYTCRERSREHFWRW